MLKKITTSLAIATLATSLTTPFVISCSNHQSNNESNIDPSVSEQLKKEKERIDNLNLSWKNESILLDDFTKIKTIPANDFLSKYINNWTSSSDFKYELEFIKGTNKNQFKIKIILGSNSSYLFSNLIDLPKSIEVQEIIDQVKQLNQDNASIPAKKDFNSLEIDSFKKDNNALLNYLSIAKNENFEYTISSLLITDNEFKFQIKIDVVKNLNELEFGVSQTTNEISFSYTLVETSSSNELTKEKERIDELKLSWKDNGTISLQELSVMEAMSANDFLSKYINNWTLSGNFKYELEFKKDGVKNQFRIKIFSESNPSYLFSNPIDLPKSIQVKELMEEVDKLNQITNIFTKNNFNVVEINAIDKNNEKLFEFLNIQKNSSFNYSIFNFSNLNSTQFKFKIKLELPNENKFGFILEQESKEFEQSFTLEKLRRVYNVRCEDWFDANFSKISKDYYPSSHLGAIDPITQKDRFYNFLTLTKRPTQEQTEGGGPISSEPSIIIRMDTKNIENGWYLEKNDGSFSSEQVKEILDALNYENEVFYPLMFLKSTS